MPDDSKKLVKSDVMRFVDVSSKALVTLVPGFGGALNSLLSDLGTIRQERRFAEFLDGIKADMENLKDKVNNDFLSTEDFYDLFTKTSKKIVETRQEDKRKGYKNIIVNAVTLSSVNYDEVEIFIKLLDELQEAHIFLLKILENPIRYDEQQGNLVGKGGGYSTSLSEIFAKLLPAWQLEQTKTILQGLFDVRLTGNIVGNFNTMMTDQGINHLANPLTDKGRRFVLFIKQPS